MGILKKLFGKRKSDEDIKQIRSEVKKIEINEDVVNLGWYYSETKNEWQLAKIREKDRRTHVYIIGASGTGKSKFMEYLIRQDIDNGRGFGIIDPHGDLIEDIKSYLAFKLSEDELKEKVILIEPTNMEYTVAFNPLEKIEGISSSEIASELVEVFRKIWHDAWGARMEDLLRNSLIALIESDKTLADLSTFLLDEDFRINILEKVSHPITKKYFERFSKLSPKTRAEWMESTLNKVDAFLSDDRIREMLSFNKSSFSFREIMDKGKILLINLNKGRLKDSADLLGSLFLIKIKIAAFSRSDIPKEKRLPWYLYIDEFQNFATESFIDTLSEARKYGLSLIMAHQNLSQLPRKLQGSILGNCGIQICFRVSRKDAEIMAKEIFEVTGTMIREKKLIPSPISDAMRVSYDYYTLHEEWEEYFKKLQSLPNRYFYAKHKIEGGYLLLRSVDVIEPEKDINKIELIGMQYLRERKREKKEIKTVEEEITTLEEIIATLTPLEKAILWAIGSGYYRASEIFEYANKKLKEWGASTKHYNDFKKAFYKLAKLPPQGKGLIEFIKRGRGFCYWLSKWGEIAFSEKFGIPSDRAINELGGGGKTSKAIALEIIKEWLEPQGYKVKKEEEIRTKLTESERGYTDLVAEKDGEILRIEIEHRSPKEQVERNIRKNLEYSDTLYIITSDEAAYRKVMQVALRTMFRLRKEKPDKLFKVKVGKIDELEKSGFQRWIEIENR